jgi:sulfur carrier protein ThiS
MMVKIEVARLTEDHFPPETRGHSFELSFEDPISLYHLLDTILHVHPSDKIVLVNGSYVSPDYRLQEGDLVQVFPMMDGG